MFLGNTSGSIVIEELGQKVELPKICMFEFDNKRKMMSVIVEDKGDNGQKTYKLLCKGADSAVLSRLSSQEQPFLAGCKVQLEQCSKYGLRTLCMAMRVLSQYEVDKIKSRFVEISKSMDKEKLLEEFLADIEKDMFLLGCSAVEDRLQDEVPETIAKLLEASRLAGNRRHQSLDAHRGQDGDCRKYRSVMQADQQR